MAARQTAKGIAGGSYAAVQAYGQGKDGADLWKAAGTGFLGSAIDPTNSTYFRIVGGTLGMSIGNRIDMDQGRGDARYAQLGASFGEIAGGLAGAFEFGFSRPCLAGDSWLPRVASGLLSAAPDAVGTLVGGLVGGLAGGNVEAALEGIQLGQAAAQRAFSVYQWTQYNKVCFAAGTPLLTPNGHKLIEQFRAGDRLLTRDEHDPSAPVLVSVVEEVFVNTGRIMSLHVGGQVLRTTSEHPFWVQGQGWTAAGALQAGDRLSSHDGQWSTVEEVYDTGEYERVYNLRVAEFHTYFVGSEEWGFSVWAHNAECFRVIRNNEDPSAGLRPKNPNATYSLHAHVSKGSTLETQYISTTKSRAVAEQWAQKDQRRIVRIETDDLPSGSRVIDQTDPAVAARELRHPIPRNLAAASQEVVIQGEIPPQAIRGVVSDHRPGFIDGGGI